MSRKCKTWGDEISQNLDFPELIGIYGDLYNGI
jgi:hypothetical protein